MHATPIETTPHNDEDVTFALPTESYDCPDCGRTVVPTGDHLPDLRLEHRCPPVPPDADRTAA